MSIRSSAAWSGPRTPKPLDLILAHLEQKGTGVHSVEVDQRITDNARALGIA
jgi:hypothetical protein